MDLSFVIPCSNEEQHLPSCLDSLLEQTIKPMQIIVVLNGCTDNSERIAKDYQKRFVDNNIEFDIVNSKKGLINARATGFSKVRGNLIASIDADSILIPQWVQYIFDSFEKDNNIVGVTGKTVFRNKSIAVKLLNLFNAAASRTKKTIPLRGNNCTIKNLNIDWCEGYNAMKEALESNGCILESHHDDFFLMHRLNKHGNIIYKKEAKASLFMKDKGTNKLNIFRLLERWQNRKQNSKMIADYFEKHKELVVD